jgi:hypothetical protein
VWVSFRDDAIPIGPCVPRSIPFIISIPFRVSPRGVAKANAAAAAVASRPTRDGSTSLSDECLRQNSRLAQVIALKRAGGTNLKVDTTRTETAVSPDGGGQANGGEQMNGGEQPFGEYCHATE